jgi:ribosome-binding protein aMBF1 (putative translation factor)
MMDDLEKYIAKRKRQSPDFARTFEPEYENFKIGVILHLAREEAGVTQEEEIAKKLRTKKSAISRIENHAEDIRLSTLHKYAQALGKTLQVRIA